MTSRNWPNGFARACVTISLLAGVLAAQPAQKAPAVALVNAADAAQWQDMTREAGWRVIAAEVPAGSGPDQRVLALAKQVEAAIASGSVDPARIYVAGRGNDSALVFYTISRMPDLWAAGVAVGGSPKPAIDTNRVWAVNFTLAPVLWLGSEADVDLARQLKFAKMNLEFRAVANSAPASTVIDWLATHRREIPPPEIDCETNSPEFARCYWIRMTKFDPNERNDVLEATRIPGGSGAALDLGGFGFKLDDPGPGVLITYLPEKYNGPLKLNDRIVELDGRRIENAKHYQALMEKFTEEKGAVATVQRGKERIRVETRVVVPRAGSGITARVQARYLPAEKRIEIVTRTVTELRATLPAEWMPAGVLWNGLTLENIKDPGCWVLSMQKELLRAEKCQ
ncbi:MAG: hypothetical protein JST11_12730 [Acidobacteria bacterium]|nr:hypothetical protein [Acidobacteriota bacterium]